MKENISIINQSIEEKRNRLKEKAERYFASITISPNCNQLQKEVTTTNGNIPPISYILYGSALLAGIGAIASEAKALCLSISAASAFGGYKLSKCPTSNKASIMHSNVNIGFIKNDVTSNVLDSVKKITQEWEEFMELKQREVQSAISSSSLSDSEKDSMASKVFIYEVIDISISEFSSAMNASTNTTDIKNNLSAYKAKVISAIEQAANKQISKYESLVQ